MEQSTPEVLNQQFGIADQVQFRADPGGLPVAIIENQHAAAQIALQGAQVVAFHPHGAEPVLFQSAHAVHAPGKGIRGGIPICWPWFGAHPSDQTRPQHGLVRTRMWSVLATSALDDGVTEVQLELGDTPETRALWPHRFQLMLTVTIGRELRVALETRNPGAQPVQVTEALHTYFVIGDIGALVVRGLEGVEYGDKADGWRRKVQEGPVTIVSETDRVYVDTPAACIVEDPALHRRIHIDKEGSQSTVVWNPWVERAREFADFGTDDYRRMICIEVGNALDNVVTIEPGAVHRLATTIRVEPIRNRLES
jgi:glucose-6-phosphate 1-epimerase